MKYVDGQGNTLGVYTVNQGAATPTISNPTRFGYNFNGWSPSVAATVTTDVTYTAQWTSSGSSGEEISADDPPV